MFKTLAKIFYFEFLDFGHPLSLLREENSGIRVKVSEDQAFLTFLRAPPSPLLD